MIRFDNSEAHLEENSWQRQLDRFVAANQQQLAALAWGLHLQRGERQETLGIDLKPTPHFVACPRVAIEQLNQNVESKLQEILGLVDHLQPEKEVLMIGIGSDRVKLIYFEPNPSPPECFEQVGQDVDTLLTQLEQGMSQEIKNG